MSRSPPGQALAHLLLAPPTAKLPAHTPLRRAAIDLIGRGFAQWEPHIDASRVLLAMLELCCEADNMAPRCGGTRKGEGRLTSVRT